MNVNTENRTVDDSAPVTAGQGKRKAWISRRTTERLISVLSPIALLVLWELTVRVGLLNDNFFPAPTSIASTFVSQSGELLTNTWISLQRLFWGFLLGGIPALILGIIIGLSRPIRAALDPLIAATYPIPKSAILPLILLIFGLGEASKIVTIAIGVFFPIIINTAAGVLQIGKIYFDVGNNFNASRVQVFRTIALPGALPLIMTGVKLGVGMGLILIVIAEMMGAKSGLGFMIWNSWQILSVETMYAALIVIAALGFILTLLIDELERLVVPWKSNR